MNKPKLKDVSKTIFEEIIGAFLKLLGGTITSKAGFSILLLIIGTLFLILPIEGGNEKPIAFYVIGLILIVAAASLIFNRISELRRSKK